MNSVSAGRIFWLGFKRTLPFLTGVIPFGLLYSTIGTAAGFPWWLIMALSIIVFGGSSQLVFMDLLQSLGSPFQALLGSNIVNARHLIYSAGVSQEFSKYPKKWRLLLSYLLTDQLYAIAKITTKEIQVFPENKRPWFFFGSGFSTWIIWQIACAVGGVAGTAIPDSWNLGFSIPLMFMPLIFSVSENKFAYLTCVMAAILVYFLKTLPYGLGLLLAILLASTLGYFLQKNWKKRR